MAPESSAPAPPSFGIGALQSLKPQFTKFSELPFELRVQIWRCVLAPRIIKWTRTAYRNIFTVPSNTLSVMDVCKESRAAAISYGGYRNISDDQKVLYFSPKLDYLFFDPLWSDGLNPVYTPHSGDPVKDPLDSILPKLEDIEKIMIHPNFGDERKQPLTVLEKFKSLRTVLVVGDEKSMGRTSKYLLGSVYDLKKYYEVNVKRLHPDIKIPSIAVGCLGWTGTERRKMYHDEDTRELVAIFTEATQMKDHLALLHDEERGFLQEWFHPPKPKSILKFRQAQGVKAVTASTSIAQTLATPESTMTPVAEAPETPCDDPPPYDEISNTLLMQTSSENVNSD